MSCSLSVHSSDPQNPLKAHSSPSTVSGATLRLSGSSGRENLIELVEDELHNLVLEDHMDGHVS